jgi:serine/threonine protein kinase
MPVEDSRTRGDVQALFDALPPPPLGTDTLARAGDLLRRLPDGESAALLGATVDDYTLTAVLGRGGQATVYLAEDRAGGRFALKVPHQALLNRLIREAQILFHLDHPHVVRVERAQIKGEIPYVVTEYLPQGTLADRLREQGRLPASEVRALAWQILKALAYAHRKGVVHRDLKPSNVLFAADDTVKVADFGIGRLSLVEGRQIAGTLVSAERTLFAGTPLYMAPEQVHAADVDARADLYALGKLLYEALTGLPPRTIKPVSRLVPGLHPSWDDYLFVLVEEQPGGRFPSASAALAALPSDATPGAELSPQAAASLFASAFKPHSQASAIADALTRAAESSARTQLGVLEPGDRVGDYLVVAPLGQDATFSRYLAVAGTPSGGYARLELPGPPASAHAERFAERFLDDARFCIGLPPHPHLVRVLHADRLPGGRPYRVVEHGPDQTLEAWLRQHRRATPAAALRIVRQLAQALQVLHAAGGLHRDLKPDAIRISPAGDAKLDSLGLAVDLNESLRLGADGALIGTPLYMAPEIGRVREVDGRTDLYSLGLVWYELVSGVQPLEGFSAVEILSAKAHALIPAIATWAPDLPEAHRQVLERLLATDRDARHVDANHLLDDLDRLAGEPTARAARPPRKPSLWSRLATALLPRREPPRQVPPERRRLILGEAQIEALEATLKTHRRRAGARCCLLIDIEGHPVTQTGDLAPLNLETVAALVAASFAATNEVAKAFAQPGFTTLTHEAPEGTWRLARVDRRILLVLLFDPHATEPARQDTGARELAAALTVWFQDFRDRPADWQGVEDLFEGRDRPDVDDVIDDLFGDV